MDPYTEKLLERTRQRRAMINQKLGKTPDPAVRKRALEDSTNFTAQADVDDDSPKRRCSREGGVKPKPDTPAIPSVKSRLNALSHERTQSDSCSCIDTDAIHPIPESRKSPTSSSLSRKARFAHLAENLENFEYDLSHPTISKQEDKKPKWQPPKSNDDRDRSPHHDARDSHVSSPRKEFESYQGPQRHKDNRSGGAPSTKTKAAPPPPVAPPVPPQNMARSKPPWVASPQRSESSSTAALSSTTSSPRKSSHSTPMQQPHLMASPKFTHHVKQVTNQVPVNKRVEDSFSIDDPASKPVTERLALWKKTVDTPSKEKINQNPTEMPLSDRFAAGWEQRVTQTPKVDKVKSDKVLPTPKQFCTPAKVVDAKTNEKPVEPARTAEKPVSEIRASWKQQDAENNPPRESEPTAYSVTDRMSAWEAASSSNKVSSMKKVAPGGLSNTPLAKACPSKPMLSKLASLQPNGTPVKGLAHQKSFKDSIEERAAQIGCKSEVGTSGLLQAGPPQKPARVLSTRSPLKAVHSPSRIGQSSPNKSASPTGKVGSATKTLQQKILEQVQYSKTDMLADKIRQERMAEVNALNNRYQNGLPRDDADLQQPLVVKQACPEPPPPPPILPASQLQSKTEKRDLLRAKAREDFNNKLQSMGFELSDEGEACYTFEKAQQPSVQEEPPSDKQGAQRQQSSATKKPTSIYRLVSKKCGETDRPNVTQSASTEKPPVARLQSSSSLKKVQFKDPNSSTGSDSSSGKVEETEADSMDETNDENQPSEEDHESDTQESFDDTYESESELSMPESHTSGSESSIPDSYKGSVKQTTIPRRPIHEMMDDDDVSMSAFVPASVRRQSVMPEGSMQDDSSEEDSFEYNANTNKQSGSKYKGAYSSDGSGKSNNIHKNSQRNDHRDRDILVKSEMDQLLDEAMDDLSDVEMRKKNTETMPVPRKRQSHMYATTEGELNMPNNSDVQMRAKSDGLAYSVSMYRNNRSSQEVPTASQRIARNSHYVEEHVVEENIQMPAVIQPDNERKTVHERIKELQELVSQEQSVIMQTSNALNKCCTGDSRFAGSTEQVECNRLLLVSCQKRMAYLTEIQRLKETGELEPRSQQSPKGSLSISDIRLPLKKDFVTKIGTASDCTVYYFVILIHNGPQIITTQMLSTHDPMMRGSLDFPNLIKIHGISSNYNINLEIYSMSVSREVMKDKKKKTPKKSKLSPLTMDSPGGPGAVRTTSFMLITSMPLTMKCLDKSSFTLDKIPFLSPLHGMIYMRLKCMMEQNVEERGFLTMFEDVSGLGSWHRRWCVLTGNKLCYWKYPDDETKKDPIGLVDLKRVITEKVGLIPRDICARPNTFELVSVRPPRRGEHDTLVTKTYNTMTTTKFMLSADTKEERIVWCNKINRALANIRTWHADALRPVKPSK